jgi:hypothetical protein
MYKYTRNAESAPAPRPLGCDFRVTGSLNAGSGYSEIGILNYGGGMATDDIDKFKRDVQSQVCAAGGDLIVTEVNGRGLIVRGVVFKKTDQTAQAQ